MLNLSHSAQWKQAQEARVPAGVHGSVQELHAIREENGLQYSLYFPLQDTLLGMRQLDKGGIYDSPTQESKTILPLTGDLPLVNPRIEEGIGR